MLMLSLSMMEEDHGFLMQQQYRAIAIATSKNQHTTSRQDKTDKTRQDNGV